MKAASDSQTIRPPVRSEVEFGVAGAIAVAARYDDATRSCAQVPYDDCEECHDSLYASIAVGAGIGLLIDALRTNKRTVNPSVSGVPVHVTVGRRAVGVRRVIRWQ